MKNSFKQLSIRPGFMKHNGGMLFRELSRKQYEFKVKIKKNHLNAASITHGGFIASIILGSVELASIISMNGKSL